MRACWPGSISRGASRRRSWPAGLRLGPSCSFLRYSRLLAQSGGLGGASTLELTTCDPNSEERERCGHRENPTGCLEQIIEPGDPISRDTGQPSHPASVVPTVPRQALADALHGRELLCGEERGGGSSAPDLEVAPAQRQLERRQGDAEERLESGVRHRCPSLIGPLS